MPNIILRTIAMGPPFWKALERIGTAGAAASDWRLLTGEEWPDAVPLLSATRRYAQTVIAPDRPSKRLNVYPEGETEFVAVAEEPPLRPPITMCARDVIVLIPDWRAIGQRLAAALGFIPGDMRSEGQIRQIGIVQAKRRVTRPVFLHLPAGGIGDEPRLHRDIGELRDCTILLPSARWLTPHLAALAAARDIHLETIAERLAEPPENRGTLLTRTASAPVKHDANSTRRSAILDVQPSWTWDNLHVEVDIGGKIIARYGQQRGEHRFRRDAKNGFARGIEILGRIAATGFWENPPSGASDHESQRKAFARLAKELRELIPIPGDPFERQGRHWVPLCKLKLSGALASLVRHPKDRPSDADDEI